MAIFIDSDTRLVVQGITGRDGSFHTRQMMEYGTQVVAGVTPGKGGQTFEGPDGAEVPIFNAMDEAVAATGAEDLAHAFVEIRSPRELERGSPVDREREMQFRPGEPVRLEQL